MSYESRIAALQSFKSAISGGDIEDKASSYSTDIIDWKGNSHSKFDSFVSDVKGDCQSVPGKKSAFLAEVDARIASIKAQLESEVALHSWIVTTTFDMTDAAQNRQQKYQAIDNLWCDESVKQRLRNQVY